MRCTFPIFRVVKERQLMADAQQRVVVRSVPICQKAAASAPTVPTAASQVGTSPSSSAITRV